MIEINTYNWTFGVELTTTSKSGFYIFEDKIDNIITYYWHRPCVIFHLDLD